RPAVLLRLVFLSTAVPRGPTPLRHNRCWHGVPSTIPLLLLPMSFIPFNPPRAAHRWPASYIYGHLGHLWENQLLTRPHFGHLCDSWASVEVSKSNHHESQLACLQPSVLPLPFVGFSL